MRRIIGIVTIALASIVCAIGTAWLARSAYLEFSASKGCNDVNPGLALSCLAPIPPWWLLLAGGLVGAILFGAVVNRLMRTQQPPRSR